VIGQALRMLRRDWRAGELRVLAAALVVAVASVTSVAFFADRVSRALVRDAHQLLGADLVLVSDHPWQAGIAEEIARRGLERAAATTFISMVRAGERSQLAGVKAVTENYPLRGRLRIAPAPNAADAPAQSGPARGTVWIEERLIPALEASRQGGCGRKLGVRRARCGSRRVPLCGASPTHTPAIRAPPKEHWTRWVISSTRCSRRSASPSACSGRSSGRSSSASSSS